LSAKLPSFSSTTELLIQSSAALLLVLLATLEKLERQMHELSSENESIRCLCGHRGVAVLTAATMMAEIVDIRRFPSNNHLASYAGLARHEHKTGRSDTEIATALHNHRLKNAFFAAAKNITLHNPDSHLTAYYLSLVKGGMSITEAYKRVGRALVRRIYRELKAVSEQHPHMLAATPSKATEGVTATDSHREASEAPSDMTPSDTQYTPKPFTNSSLHSVADRRRPQPTHFARVPVERRAQTSP
jgi:hypothetical protein